MKHKMLVTSETLGPEIQSDFLDTETQEPAMTATTERENYIVALDTETDLIAQGNLPPKLICVTVAIRHQGGVHTDIRGNGDPDIESFIEGLLDDPDCYIVGHYLCFDLAVICRAFPRLMPKIFKALSDSRMTDTKIREQLLRISTHGSLKYDVMPDGTTAPTRFDLANLEKRYLSLDRSAEKEGGDVWRTNFKALDGLKASEYPIEASTYAMADAEGTLLVMEAQQAAAENPNTPGPASLMTQDFQTMCDFALFLTTCSGLNTDPAMRQQIAKQLEEDLHPSKLKHLIDSGILSPAEPPRPMKRQKKAKEGEPEPEVKMTKGTEEKINTKPLHALIEKVCAEHGIKVRRTEPTEKKPDGQVSTEGDFLEEIREFCPIIEEYCQRQDKQKLVQALNAIGDATMVHPNFNVLVESGRTSSYGNRKGRPALYPSIQGQNPDPRVRPMFVSPPGWVLCSNDYSSLELVSLAQTIHNMFGHSRLREQLLDGIDPHAKLASRFASTLDPDFRASLDENGISSEREIYDAFVALKKVPECEEWFKHWRTLAKPVGLGLPGGLGVRTMRALAKAVYDVEISEEMGQTLKNLWQEEYPEMPGYFHWIKSSAIDQRDPERFAYVTPLGMYRAGTTFCAAANGKALQSPSAEGAKLAVFNVTRAMFDESLKTPIFGCRPANFVHDEILSYLPEDEWMTERALYIEKVMVESLAMIMPDLAPAIRAEPALMYRWNKKASAVYDDAGRLQVWVPKETT